MGKKTTNGGASDVSKRSSHNQEKKGSCLGFGRQMGAVTPVASQKRAARGKRAEGEILHWTWSTFGTKSTLAIFVQSPPATMRFSSKTALIALAGATVGAFSALTLSALVRRLKLADLTCCGWSETYDGEVKLVMLVRKDLKMGPGKVAAQCGHAVLATYRRAMLDTPELLNAWQTSGQTKVALKVQDELELYAARPRFPEDIRYLTHTTLAIASMLPSGEPVCRAPASWMPAARRSRRTRLRSSGCWVPWALWTRSSATSGCTEHKYCTQVLNTKRKRNTRAMKRNIYACLRAAGVVTAHTRGAFGLENCAVRNQHRGSAMSGSEQDGDIRQSDPLVRIG
jgi:peptidyl-tRNA hydrolase